MTTDQLINRIKEIGVKLPVINYEFGGFESVITKNEYIGDAVRGIEVPEIHKTFKDACIRIINEYSQ